MLAAARVEAVREHVQQVLVLRQKGLADLFIRRLLLHMLLISTLRSRP